MDATDLVIAESWWSRNDGEVITAAATVVGAIVIARLVDRSLSARGGKAAAAVAGGRLSAVADTRLRLIRRLVFFLIILLGISLALAQFPAVKRVATGVLASSAVLGLVVGFAARQTLANVIAGVLLAITQPIRIGDLVTFEDDTGEVEDVRLTYTYVRCDDGRRLVIPNERLAAGTIENHSVVDPRVQVQVSVWIAHGADVDQAVELLGEEGDAEVRVADVDADGIRLTVTAWADTPRERGKVAAGMRQRSLRRITAAGLSSGLAP
jgi:small-conductance mechanosensitive channel